MHKKAENCHTFCKEGMIIRKYILIFVAILLLVACNRVEEPIAIQKDTDENTEQLEQIILQDERVKNSVIMLHDQRLIVAVTVKTFSRFHKGKIEKQLKEQLDAAYPDQDITVSADYKARQTLKKLMKEDDPSNLNEALNDLTTLLQEET